MLRSLSTRINLLRDTHAINRSKSFDRGWYLGQYNDVNEAKIDPLRHYLTSGYLEGRYPNPVFDSFWYRRNYPSVTGNPLVDYIKNGRKTGRDPNAWFDTNWYATTNKLGPTIDPMVHYLDQGAKAGFSPSSRFRALVEAGRIPEHCPDEDPLAHFLHRCRAEGRIGACTCYFVGGWAGRRDGLSTELTITVNDEVKGSVVPWIKRPDLENTAFSNGKGYYFVFPTRLSAGDVVEIHSEFGELLRGCTVTYKISSVDEDGDLYSTRASIAARFLFGSGIEVGAFTQPTDLPPDRQVVFYDRIPSEQLKEYYDEAWGRPLFEPSLVGNADKLEGVPATSLDFLIANHVIEHMQDPICFLKRVCEVLKPDGAAMIAAPDKRFSFDQLRPITTFEHLVADHELGPARSRDQHHREFVELVGGLRGEAAIQEMVIYEENDHLCHYHVWDADAFKCFADQTIARYHLPLSVVFSKAANTETIIVLKKQGC